MYLHESSFTELARVREQQLARELELRRRIRERMLEEELLDVDTAPRPRQRIQRIRWRGGHRLGQA